MNPFHMGHARQAAMDGPAGPGQLLALAMISIAEETWRRHRIRAVPAVPLSEVYDYGGFGAAVMPSEPRLGLRWVKTTTSRERVPIGR